MIARTAFVIGPGEVGRRLASGLEQAGWQVNRATRTQGWDAALAATGCPRILAMREEDVVAAFRRFPEAARRDLVLVQNGFLEVGLGAELQGVTRGLIWFTAKGEFFLPLRPSLIHGPWAQQLASAWRHAGLQFEVVPDARTFQREMIIKGIWNCVVGLPLAVHGVDLATYQQRFPDEIAQIAQEACRACAAEYGVDIPPSEVLECIAATTAELGWVATQKAKALPWRNGAIAAFGRNHGVATPTTDRLLGAAGEG
ncbi:MAG: ketopantoate reductase family protein [Planctomycetota bacterium]